MKSASIPANELARLAALQRYAVLDTPAESPFDDCTRLAAQLASADAAFCYDYCPGLIHGSMQLTHEVPAARAALARAATQADSLRDGLARILAATDAVDPSRLAQELALLAVKTELRRRMHRPITEQGQYLRAVVAGHGRYFAVPCNGARVQVFRHQVARLWHRTLCRRSQTKHLSWKRMCRIVEHWLPRPPICHPYPGQRLIVTTRGKSRVR